MRDAHPRGTVPGSRTGTGARASARAPTGPTAAAPPGLVRDRLLAAVEAPGARLILLSAAPGTGKSTLLAQYAWRAAATGRRTVSVRADVRDRDESGLNASVERVLADASGDRARQSPSAGDVAQRMAGMRELTVLVDDAHVLAGSPGERALAEIVEHAPDGARFIVAGRHEPGPAMVRLGLAGDAVSLTGEDLRFRSWEVAELFDRLYGEPLPPEDTAALARHTEGWAAGLQMFHLATVDRPLAERRAAVAGLWGRGRLLRSYLAGTVLHGLDADTRDFLVRSSALLLLDGSSCDALLGREDSAVLLDRLAERQMLTLRVDETAGLYRYHAALQVHLEALLIDALGTDASRGWYRRAAALSESAGRPYEALRAYLRAGAWDEARRVLSEHGAHIASLQVPEEAVVAGLADDDPWLALAAARSMVADGDLEGAVAAYRSASEVSGGQVVEEACRHEGRCAEAWLPSGAGWPAGSPRLPETPTLPWPVALREAVRSAPGRFVADATADPGQLLTAAVAALLAGRPDDAVRRARLVEGEAAGPVALGARLVAESVEAGLQPARGARGLERLAAEAETLGQPWLARLARALTAVPGGRGRTEAAAVRLSCLQEGDPWGALLAGLAAGVGALVDGEAPCDLLEDCVDRAHRLEAGTVEAWARGLHAVALARAGLPHVELEARRAETCARQVGVPAARTLAFSALAVVDGSYEALANVAAAEHRLPRPRSRPEDPDDRGSLRAGRSRRAPETGTAAPPPASLRCLGGFSLSIGGVEVDWSLLRPRARTLLRMLAVHVGRPVNEEHLLEALWPRLPPSSARHNLHVAVSALRRALEPDAARGASRLLVRAGPAYLLTLPYGSEADVTAFRSAVRSWAARRGRSPEVLRPLLQEVLARYTGDLLPEDGPAEWVVPEREALRSDAARAAIALAEIELMAGNWPAAAEAGERAVTLDPFGDVAWRLLASAYEADGNTAARERTRRRYAAVLRELGVDGPGQP